MMKLIYCLGIDPPDIQREKEGTAALQDAELKVDHSVCISSTMFRINKTPPSKPVLHLKFKVLFNNIHYCIKSRVARY